MYADIFSSSMKAAIHQTVERRERQNNYNLENNIIPKTIQKQLPVLDGDAQDVLTGTVQGSAKGRRKLVGRKGGNSQSDLINKFKLGAGKFASTADNNENNDKIIDNLTSSIDAVRNEMEIAASELEFEKAAYLRDRLLELESMRD